MASDKEANINFKDLGYDPLRVSGKELEPGKHFRWVSTANKVQFERQKAKGFRPVDSTKSKVNVEGVDKQVDSTIRVGDLILCEMPRERKEALDRFQQERQKGLYKASETQFRKAVESATKEVKDSGCDVKDLIVEERK